MLPLFQLFAEMYIEDPLFVCEVGHSFAVDEDPGAARKPVSEKQTQMVSFWSRLLEIISLRHRIMESSWESEVRHCSCCCNRAIISSHFRLNFRFSCLLVITLGLSLNLRIVNEKVFTSFEPVLLAFEGQNLCLGDPSV